MDRRFDRCDLGILVLREGYSPQGADGSVESGKVGCAVTEPDEVRVARRHLREHGAAECWKGVEAVRGGGAGREIELGGFESDHPQGDCRARGFGRSPRGAVVRRQLRRSVEGDMDDGSQAYALVLLERVRGQHFMRVRRFWHAARHEIEGRSSLGGQDHHTELRGVERVLTRTRGLTAVGAESHRCRADFGEPGDLGCGPSGVHLGVEAVGGHEGREGRFRTPASGRGGHYYPTYHADQDRHGQPRSPSVAQLCPEHHADCPQRAPLTSASPHCGDPRPDRQGG